VKLDDIHRHRGKHLRYLGLGRVDKERYYRHKRRNRGNDFRCPGGINCPGTLGVEDQAYSVSAIGYRYLRIFRPGDTANFDTRVSHWLYYWSEK
jgi:hypothetical protein